MEFITGGELELELQITLNRHLYENKIIDEKMYNYVASKLIKLLANEKNKKVKNYCFILNNY